MLTIKGTDYTGTKNITRRGQTCQRWDSNSPHKHSYHEYDKDEKFCRNTRGDEQDPWCYTTNKDERWDFCTIPLCDAEECIRSKNGYEYLGSQSTTVQGKPCVNACRASANDPAPRCYTVDTDIEWDTCALPRCSWNTDIALYSVLEDNYCRNPDGQPAPWCLTTNPDKRLELCDIPYCQDHLACLSIPCLHGGKCEEVAGGFQCTCQLGYAGKTCEKTVSHIAQCRRSKHGYEYNGTINTTVSNRTCQRWEIDTPHEHEYNGIYNMDSENYCRNKIKKPDGPWCYTTDPKTLWEYCDIPYYSTPEKECIESYNSVDYFGKINYTAGGLACQKWGDQAPHKHEFSSIADQGNYCRNPIYDYKALPWCYTADRNKPLEYCAIPRC